MSYNYNDYTDFSDLTVTTTNQNFVFVSGTTSNSTLVYDYDYYDYDYNDDKSNSKDNENEFTIDISKKTIKIYDFTKKVSVFNIKKFNKVFLKGDEEVSVIIERNLNPGELLELEKNLNSDLILEFNENINCVFNYSFFNNTNSTPCFTISTDGVNKAFGVSEFTTNVENKNLIYG
jgi:hypothetical protein